MENQFELGGRQFKLLKLPPLVQFHVVRRIGPILSDIMPAMKGIDPKALTAEGVASLPDDKKFDVIAKFAGPLTVGMSKLSNEDSEYVLFSLLSAVEMQQASGNWIRVYNGTMLMVQDLDFRSMMHLAGQAFAHNLSNFFGALPQ